MSSLVASMLAAGDMSEVITDIPDMSSTCVLNNDCMIQGHRT